MTDVVQPTYDEMLPSDLAVLQGATDRQLADWYHELNSCDRWPEELLPRGRSEVGMSQEEWKSIQPDRRDDLMEWIRNRVGSKYLLMIWQTEKMLARVMGAPSVPDSYFEAWWNEPYPGDPSITKGENHLRSVAWWAKTREEWRASRKARGSDKG